MIRSSPTVLEQVEELASEIERQRRRELAQAVCLRMAETAGVSRIGRIDAGRRTTRPDDGRRDRT